MNHSFDIEFAKEYGLNAAILYRNFQYWIAKNKANGHNLRDGRTWTYTSMRALADLFSYLSVWDIRKALETLMVDRGPEKPAILLKANYNTKGYDRTTWYAFYDEKTALRGLPSHLWNSQIDDVKPANGLRKTHKSICESHTPIPNPNPNSKTDIKPNNNGVEILPQEILDLDLRIVEARNKFCNEIEKIFYLTQKEKTTFAHITKHLVNLCQAGQVQPSIFQTALGWAREAKANGKKPKALFVAILKEKTGFKKQKNLLMKTCKKRPPTSNSGRINGNYNQQLKNERN